MKVGILFFGTSRLLPSAFCQASELVIVRGFASLALAHEMFN